jgi:deoxyribose-phosphate aldolase
MKRSENIQVRLLEPAFDDAQLKESIEKLKESAIRKILVLPSAVARTKNLLGSNDKICVGSVVDFPLGAGTLEKKVYEAAQLFQEGADFLEVSINSSDILTHQEYLAELEQLLKPLAVGRGEIIFALDTAQYKELTLIELEQVIRTLGWQKLSLGSTLGYEKALHTMALFRYDTEQKLQLVVNVEQCTAEQLEELFLKGAASVGIAKLEVIERLNETSK